MTHNHDQVTKRDEGMYFFGNRWKKAQRGESSCWESNADKVNSSQYRSLKKEYWEKMLSQLLPHWQEELRGKKMLDFGCGPSGVVMVLSSTYPITCIDPLMHFYLKRFPFLQVYDHAHFVDAKIEELTTTEKYDYVFGFNALDHTESPARALDNISRFINKDGRLILTLNCHNYKLLQFVLKQGNHILDKFHPHQYTIAQYTEIIERHGFVVVATQNIDAITHWINEVMRDEEYPSSTLLQQVKNILSPERLLFSLLHLCGVRRYGSGKEKAVYAHTAFICQPKKVGRSV